MFCKFLNYLRFFLLIWSLSHPTGTENLQNTASFNMPIIQNLLIICTYQIFILHMPTATLYVRTVEIKELSYFCYLLMTKPAV